MDEATEYVSEINGEPISREQYIARNEMFGQMHPLKELEWKAEIARSTTPFHGIALDAEQMAAFKEALGKMAKQQEEAREAARQGPRDRFMVEANAAGFTPEQAKFMWAWFGPKMSLSNQMAPPSGRPANARFHWPAACSCPVCVPDKPR